MPNQMTDYIENRIATQISDKVFQGAIGKIQKFDKEKMRADVDILLYTQFDDDDDIKDIGTLPNLPVTFIYGGGGYYIRPVYEKDDLVWVTYSSTDISKPLKGEKENEDQNAFNRLNACVVGGVAKKDFTHPKSFSDDGLLIGNGDDVYLQILTNSIYFQNSNGFVELKSSGQVNINDNFTVDP